MVIGENQKMPAALIVVATEFIQEWAKRKGIDCGNSQADMIKNEKVLERIQEEVNHYNAEFGQFERVKRFELTDCQWTPETGELTPTMKPKRKFIMEKHKDLVEKIYGAE